MNVIKIILSSTACAFLCSCAHYTNVAYEDDKVKVLHKDTVNYLNVHASHDEMWLVAFGITYKDVRGLAPFYLEIPDKDSILFVTGRTYDDGQATVHVLNYKTKKEINFPAFDSHIGREIGGTPNSGGSEKIETVKGNKVVISANFLNRQYRYYLDLQKPEFEKEEGVEPDPIHPGVTNAFVWVNGKLPRN
jgi:hypothetical protein